MDIADSVKTYYRIERTDFPVPMHMNQCNFRPFRWNPPLVKFSPRRLIARAPHNEIIGMLLLNVLIKGVYKRTVFTTFEFKLLINTAFYNIRTLSIFHGFLVWMGKSIPRA